MNEMRRTSPGGLTLLNGSKGQADNPATPAAREVLAEACDFTGNLLDVLAQTVGLYRTGDAKNGGEAFVGLVQGLELFVQILAVVEIKLGVNFAMTSHRGEPLVQAVNRLNGVFTEVVRAQECRDLVFLADILEYELTPLLEQWRDLFRTMDEGDATGIAAER